jgi:excisionase family DNA binding protein
MTDMTVADVALVCGVTERTVRRWLREGRLPAHRVGGRVRISDHAVRELAAPYGETPVADPGAAPDTPTWLASLHDPGRLAEVDARRAARATALMDMVRAMATPAADPSSPGLVREGRDEQDARWDERLA